jgi:hypothetical protein
MCISGKSDTRPFIRKSRDSTEEGPQCELEEGNRRESAVCKIVTWDEESESRLTERKEMGEREVWRVGLSVPGAFGKSSSREWRVEEEDARAER